MQIDCIKISDFKGIKNLTLDFKKHPSARFYTLVGLNESGKTTILEAINNFCYGPEKLEGLDLDHVGTISPEYMIPISQRSNFNGAVVIAVTVSFSETEIQLLRKQLSENYPNLKFSEIPTSVEVSYSLAFSNSKLMDDCTKRMWNFHFFYRVGKKKKWQEAKDKLWLTAVKFLTGYFPDIIYFPNFLFDFPDRIYLDSQNNETDIFYRKVLQDILDAIGSGCKLETHVLERMKNGDGNLRAVLIEMDRELTKTVFSSWNSIFGGNASKKKVHVVHGVDQEINDSDTTKGKYYLEFQLEDANGQCRIGERSLGFRWFFVFRLLTYYRGHRNSRNGNKKVLFLLDEPASNLHPTAQTKLLKCLEELPNECQLIYTTHSHHLINPKWLETAYVIKNAGLEYQETTDFDYSAKQTNVTATLYRDFVGHYPDQTWYFKPILDVLDYAPSQLEFRTGGVLVEGKNDFYVLNYINSCLKLNDLNFTFVPGGGCGKLDPLIQLYTGWGKQFCILLDSDEAGETSKAKYIDEWEIIVKDKVFSFSDIRTQFAGKQLESFFTQKDIDLIFDNVGQPTNRNKKAINRALQELYVRNEFLVFDSETQDNFKNIFEFLKGFFNK